MTTGEKVESSVYGLFLLIIIVGLLFVGISMAGMVVTGTCEVGAVGPDGHSQCYNDAFDRLDAVLGVDSNPRW